MSLREYVELLKYIEENHSFSLAGAKGKSVKYIENIYDFRTSRIFCIKIRPICGEEKIFSLTNENRDRDLKNWIYEWLNSDNL